MKAILCMLFGHRWRLTDVTMDAEVHVCQRCAAEKYHIIGDE